ncbi:MAG: pyruvate, water dikinase regulatory protein [Lautropia sp.]|nr:pyruvate, water dikinase regulatory protein [Lautropia sp.]
MPLSSHTGGGRPERTAFFISDGTGITAETFGCSLLSQFDDMHTRYVRLPFIDTEDKAREAVARINAQGSSDGQRPLVFSTLANPAISGIVQTAAALYLDLIGTFVSRLEGELGRKSSHSMGQFHRIKSPDQYQARIDAINFSLSHDDGQQHAELHTADVILVGVSRCGKTPTSLYLSIQHGIKAANYPLIPEDFDRMRLPEALYKYKNKLFGLTITPERLHEVRSERRPDSRYASLANCREEVAAAESMMRREGIAMLSTTTKSIEEIAATILTVIEQPDAAF